LCELIMAVKSFMIEARGFFSALIGLSKRGSFVEMIIDLVFCHLQIAFTLLGLILKDLLWVTFDVNWQILQKKKFSWVVNLEVKICKFVVKYDKSWKMWNNVVTVTKIEIVWIHTFQQLTLSWLETITLVRTFVVII